MSGRRATSFTCVGLIGGGSVQEETTRRRLNGNANGWFAVIGAGSSICVLAGTCVGPAILIFALLKRPGVVRGLVIAALVIALLNALSWARVVS
jgi:hypothetical protein